MKNYDVKRIILADAINTEVIAMQTENKRRIDEGYGGSQAYSEAAFFSKAEELRELANKHDDQL